MKAAHAAVIGAALVLTIVLVYAAVALLLTPRTLQEQITKIEKDGVECLAVERTAGRIDAIDCNWP